MNNKLSVLMTVFNEADFIDYAIRACLPHVDELVIVEGAYQESISCGAHYTSTDGTVEIISKYLENPKVVYKHVNKETDKDHRNAGLLEIKYTNPNGYVLIIDGDEIYSKENFKMVNVTVKNMERANKLAAYFTSLTFVDDFSHYTKQEFPRLFKITPRCEFVSDNYMTWPDLNKGWTFDVVTKNPYLQYHHYSFAKNEKRIKLKKNWWNTRFKDTNPNFNYDWYQDTNGKWFSPNHEILEYTGKHPEIMKDHPLWIKNYQNKKLKPE